MKIVVQEVKTFYTIELTASDVQEAMSYFYNSTAKHMYPRAFEWLILDTDPATWPIEKITEIIERTFFTASNADTHSLLADFFGFDGWSHAGRWNRNKKVYEMTAYNRGEHLK